MNRITTTTTIALLALIAVAGVATAQDAPPPAFGGVSQARVYATVAGRSVGGGVCVLNLHFRPLTQDTAEQVSINAWAYALRSVDRKAYRQCRKVRPPARICVDLDTALHIPSALPNGRAFRFARQLFKVGDCGLLPWVEG